jgi:ABC-type polysaccharide/polyol phosphate export permease
MRDGIKAIWEYRGFFAQFVNQQLRLRYQSSVLGFVWTLLNPLLIYASFCVIFSLINHWDLKGYGIYFFSGYMAWTFFATASMMGADSVVANGSYVTRIYVPKAVFPLAAVAVSLVDLLASFAILAVLMLVLGAGFSPALLILPVSALLLTVFVCGVCLLTSMWTVFLRDFRHLLSSLLFIWFFFCPILYRFSVVPSAAQRYFEWNPMLPFLRLFQKPISAGMWPAGSDLAAGAAIAVGTAILGCVLFFRSESRFYYYV